MTIRRWAAAAVAPVVALAVTLGTGAALADANDKNPGNDYDADASSAGALAVSLPGPLAGPGLVIGSTSGRSSTDREATSSDASASSLEVPGHAGLGPSVACHAEGSDTGGADHDADATSALTLGGADLVEVALLPASCQASAVKTNTAGATARTAVADMSVAGLASAGLVASESSNRTTSGQAHARSSVTVVEADAPVVGEVVVLRCTVAANDNHGTEHTSAGLTVVNGIDIPAPCPGGAEAGYSR